MEKAASTALGEAVEVGLTVSSRGEAKKAISRAAGGAVGAIAGAGNSQQGGITTPGDYSGHMFIALGTSHIAFFSIKQGLLKNSVKELLAKHPRSDVQSIELQKKGIAKIDVVLTDGTHYGFECGWALAKKVRQMKEALGV